MTNSNKQKLLQIQGYIFLIVILCFQSRETYCQKRNNIWQFGNHSGLDFNTDPPTPLDSTPVWSETMPPYYVSSICDNAGQLLFYTDGITAWNRHNKEIPRYLHRWPWSGFVMPLICPYPGNDSLCYIFGVSDHSYANRLQYLTINMKGDAGYGEIVYPQPSTLSNYYTILLQNASVLLAGTAHCNQKDQWIVSHSEDALYSFLVTADGVDSIPVVSQIPHNIISPQNIYGGYSNLKFCANGEKLMLPLSDENAIVVLDFNNLTGQFSNPVRLNLPPGNHLEDAELSPNGSKLYYGSYTSSTLGDEPAAFDSHDIFQLDLDAGNAEAIQKTSVKISPFSERTGCSPHVCFFEYRTLQLGPDGKIYVSMRVLSPINLDLTLSVIQYPNEKGLNAFYKLNAINLRRKAWIISYNYIRSQTFTLKDNGIQVQKAVCADAPVNFSLLFSRIDSVKWDFGDSQSGNNNYSTLLKPQHTYPNPGSYIAKAVIYNKCIVDTAVAKVQITEDLSVHISPSLKDTTVCTGDQLVLNATTPNATNYLWSNGRIYPDFTITTAGDYNLTVYNACSIDRRDFSVKYENCNCNVFVPTAFTPNHDGLNDVFKPSVQCFATDYRFSIYNRYGMSVFTTTEIGKGWAGNTGAAEVGTGTYVWTVEYRDPNNKQFFRKHGTVVLMR